MCVRRLFERPMVRTENLNLLVRAFVFNLAVIVAVAMNFPSVGDELLQ